MRSQPSTTRHLQRAAVAAVLAVVAGLLPVLAVATLSPTSAQAAAAAPGSLTVQVKAARSVGSAAGLVHQGDVIDTFAWMINADDTGNPGTSAHPLTDQCLPPNAAGGATDANYADTCPWPSVRKTAGGAPIIAQGDESTFATGKALDGLAPGKYLISVLSDGFKIDGKHFTVTSGGTADVLVQMNPTPLPLATIRIQVFNDNVPVDATYEIDAEGVLPNFTANLTDVFGTMSVDYYGNPLCTSYVRNTNGSIRFSGGKPVVAPTSTGVCRSNRNGLITIPNLGPNRYAATVAPPKGETNNWVQTTTLEGSRDFDIWIQEGDTGLDTELSKGAEPVPAVQFGFVHTRALPQTASVKGEVTGVVVAGLPYIGGTPNGAVDGAMNFPLTKNGGPIPRPWIALSSLRAGDQATYVGRGNADGSFDIEHVPNGTYQLTMWDTDINYILHSFNVTVAKGAVAHVGNQALTGWFTHMHGHVFIDTNENGRRDPGEAGVPQFPLTVRERDNTLMDQFTNATTTDSSGAYDIRQTYPLSKWLVMEAFDTRFQTTGITYRGENEDQATTRLGSLVDLNFLPVIGIGGQVDWGVKPYARGTNGGIVGTVSYDTTRNELDPADAASEGYQPGIPDVPVHLYAPKACPTTVATEMANICRNGKEIVPLKVDDPANPGTLIDNPAPDRGALAKGAELNSTVSETWAPPRGCTAYDYKGDKLTAQRALPEFGATADRLCVESPMMGVAIGPSDSTPGNAGQTVNGNYGFGTSRLNQYAPGNAKNPAPDHDLPLYADLAANGYNEQDLKPGDYLVEVDIPDNPVGGGAMYTATGEEDVNVFDGDTYLPQANIPFITPAVAVNPPAGAGSGDPTPPTEPPSQAAGIVSGCAGALHRVKVTNQAFLDGGGSPFEGADRPSCAAKLVTVRDSQATAPNFNLFTDVPLPTHFWGLTINDLGIAYDQRSVNYGEAQGIPNVPVGLYDYAGRLMDTTHTDFNGFYEALEPSTGTYNCPVPAGPCANMYRFVGNDPGQPGHLNSDYNPRFRTIAATFQGWPGLYTVTDEAPTQVASIVTNPDGTQANVAQCDLGNDFPQLLSVDHPYARRGDVVTIKGINFGSTPGTLKVGTTTISVPSADWSDEQIKVTLPTDTSVTLGADQISITRVGGLTSVNGLSMQVIDPTGSNSATNPRIVEVNRPTDLPANTNAKFTTIQAALEAARPTGNARFWLVVVWPNEGTTANPRGEYTENLIVHHRVRIQGVGPGGFDSAGNAISGSVIDGLGYSPDNDQGTAWIDLLSSLTYSGDQQVPDGAVVTFLNDPDGRSDGYSPALDGFTITGGVQQTNPTNINTTGQVNTPYGAAGALISQGGGVYVHARVQNLTVSNNIIVGNGGSYGGGVRVGTPYIGNGVSTGNGNNATTANTDFTLTHNQVRDNGGTNLAGGVGLFSGTRRYQVTDNAICGNHSAEYGGAITSYGYQGPAGNAISHNRIWFNGSYDEGGGVMVAGELPSNPNALSHGSGGVSIDHNEIAANIANDDGGGIRLLQTTGDQVKRPNNPANLTSLEKITISNNDVVNNISAHEGGGIALDDAAFVDVVGTTVARNLSIATAITSDGNRAPAGLSTATLSTPLLTFLQARGNAGFNTGNSATNAGWGVTYGKPTLLDDLFWDNRAGTYRAGVLTGIGVLPDGTDGGIDHWDMGMIDTPVGPLSPRGSVIQTLEGTDATTSNPQGNRVTDTSSVTTPYAVSVDVLASRTFPAFREAAVVAEVLPPNLMGDYHLLAGSQPIGAGLPSTAVTWLGNSLAYLVNAPSDDRDGDPRPTAPINRWDAGADQFVPPAP